MHDKQKIYDYHLQNGKWSLNILYIDKRPLLYIDSSVKASIYSHDILILTFVSSNNVQPWLHRKVEPSPVICLLILVELESAWFSGTGSVFPVYLSVVWGTYYTQSPSLPPQLTFKIWRLIQNLTLTTLHIKISKWLLLHLFLVSEETNIMTSNFLIF